MTPTSHITVEGGLLPPQLLERIAGGDTRVVGLSPGDYHCDSIPELNQGINRAWASLTGRWATFRRALATLPETDRATALTREKWLLPLFQELGYGRLTSAKSQEVDGRTFPISHRWGHTSIHLLGVRTDLDKRTPGEKGAAASSPHGLVQDLLNHDSGQRWAFLSNGLELRLLRDHHSLTRQAFLSFDLEAIFDGEQFSAFRLLWLLCHQSRVEAEDPKDCWLEKWFAQARDEGVRALDRLREGVEKALEHLGAGFLTHRANERLRAELSTGRLTTQDYYRQLLRLVYRLIFLFVAEDRDMLLDPSAPAAARDRYQRLYATRRLRTLAMRRRGGPHGDGWAALTFVMGHLDRGCPALGLPGLGSFLWGNERETPPPGRQATDLPRKQGRLGEDADPDLNLPCLRGRSAAQQPGGGGFASRAIPDLEGCQLTNEALFAAFAALCVVQDGPVRRPVDWAGVQSDELGSVYESLMELVPRIHSAENGAAGATGAFALVAAAGNERKTTGSYYTPSSLVDCLLDSALEPVLDDACRQPQPEQAILALSVVDPACGSGHFLVAAARRMAHRLARVRAEGLEPSPPEVQHALREVVSRCIYGVDLNPMAVELCKVSLWMEALEPGRPLSFLDAHIQHGNALLGTTPELLEAGIPDDAWDPLVGDDKTIARALKKRNSKAAGGQRGMDTLWFKPRESQDIVGEYVRVDAMPDGDRPALEQKELAWEDLVASPAYRHKTLVANLWCMAFVWPKQPGRLAEVAPTNDQWLQLRDGQGNPNPLVLETAASLSRQYHFFHWHLGFPRVFARGGFDVVLGNPPWERVKLQELEFFATRSEVIASAPNASMRKKLINALPFTDAPLWDAWCAASREAEGQSHLARNSGRFPLCGKGDVNTYALFAEHNRALLGPKGRAGFIVPTGIATDESTSAFLRHVTERREFQQLISHENEGTTFGGVNNRQSFCLMSLSKTPVERTKLCFFVNQPLPENAGPLDFELEHTDFVLFNPNTGNCPTFRTRRDANINLTLYRHAGILWREGDPDGNPWGIRFMRMLDMANDSNLFRTQKELVAAGWQRKGNRYLLEGRELLPLIEAKMVHLFDHRYGTYEGATQAHYNKGFLPHLTDEDHADPSLLTRSDVWVPASEVESRLDKHWQRQWLLGWRDICRRTDIRTVIASLIPRTAVGHTTPLLFPEREPKSIGALYANLCSLVLDYAARQKVGGTHLTYNLFKQLPILPPSRYLTPAPWDPAITLRDWLLPRVLELTYTAWDLEPFARDVGYEGPPFRWDPARRFELRCELDAAFFHLYGIARADVDYILETFPIVKRHEEKQFGEYRTLRRVGEIYEELGRRMEGGLRGALVE